MTIMNKHRKDLKMLKETLNNGGDPEKGIDGAKMGSYLLTKIRNEIPEEIWRKLDSNDMQNF